MQVVTRPVLYILHDPTLSSIPWVDPPPRNGGRIGVQEDRNIITIILYCIQIVSSTR